MGTELEGGEDLLSTLVSYFENSEEATETARTQAERDRDYYDGRQLTSEEEAALRKRKQPPLVINRIRRKVDYLIGLEKQGRTDPKAYPRNPDDEMEANAATDALRFVCEDCDFEQHASAVWENMLIEGAGGVDIYVMPRQGAVPKICIEQVAWDRMFWDPHSRFHDFRDAKYLGAVVWMDEGDVLARWPGSEDAIETAYAADTTAETYDDRPKYSIWADGKRKRVRVVQICFRHGGTWHVATYTRGGFLDAPQVSPYVDDEGQPEPSLIFASAYVSRDNERYGIVRDMIGPQDEVNKRRSKLLHLLNVRQVVAEQGAVRDVDAARREIAKPDGYVEVAPGMRFEIQQTADLATGQAQVLQEAKAELDLMGPNAAMSGEAGSSASGRAIALQQQGGMIEAGALGDLHRHWKRRVYRALWNRIKQFWTEETWVRVTDRDETTRFVGLNRKVTLADKLADMAEPEAMALVQQMQLQPGDPRLQMVVDVENRINSVPVDIVIEEVPDVAVLQTEQFQMLADMVRAGLPVPPDIVIEASSLRDKRKIIERMRGMGPDGQPMPPPPEVQKLQLEVKKHEDTMALKRAELEVKAAQAMKPEPAAPMQMPEGVDPIDVGRLQLDTFKAVEDVRLREMEIAQRGAAAQMKARQPARTPA